VTDTDVVARDLRTAISKTFLSAEGARGVENTPPGGFTAGVIRALSKNHGILSQATEVLGARREIEPYREP
jgi:hypothetical protein